MLNTPVRSSFARSWCSGAIDPNGRGKSGYRKRGERSASFRFRRVVQGALKLILEPIFEADFQPGSYGYRPKKSAHAAVQRVSEAILEGKTFVIDLDLRSYFDFELDGLIVSTYCRPVSVRNNRSLSLNSFGRSAIGWLFLIRPRSRSIRISFLTESPLVYTISGRSLRFKRWAVSAFGSARMLARV